MKKCLFYLTVLCCFSICAYPQSPCPLNGTSTDPANPQPSAPPAGRTFMKNQTDWKTASFNASNSSYYTSNSPITSFFMAEVNNPNFQHIAKGTTSDFYPQEGWELIKRDYGKLASGANNPVHAEGPYEILYNRYSGILRVLACFPGLGAQQAINVRLSFKAKDASNSNQNQLGLSALLNTYNSTVRALDQKTLVNSVITPAVFSGSDKRFFYADFQTAYDACTCQFESALLVEFSTFNQLNVALSGRLIAVSEQIAQYNNNTYKLDKNQDFLSSLYLNSAQSNNAQTGMLMYTTINKMSSDYRNNILYGQPANQQSALTTIVNGFSDFLTVGGLLTSVTPASAAFKAGFNLVSGVTKFFSAGVKTSSSSAAPPPQPSVIHGEMSMTGTVTDTRLIGSSYFNFANPGSKKSTTKPEYNDGVIVSPPDVDYPVYNEVLGTFALLESPKWNYGKVNRGYEGTCYDDGGPSGGLDPVVFHLGRDLKYVYNPKANINESLSKISAAWVIDLGPWGGPGCDTYPEGINMDEAYKSNDLGFGTYNFEYVSPFLELKYFKNFSAGVTFGGYYRIQHVYIRLKLETVSNDLDRAGNKNQSISVLTYEIPWVTASSATDIPVNLCPMYQNNQYYNSAYQFTASGTDNYWGTVYINGALTVKAGVTRTINATNVVYGPNGSVGSGVTINIGTPLTPIAHSTAQAASVVTSFCNGTSTFSKYQANLAQKTATDLTAVRSNPSSPAKDSASFMIYPNPANTNINIQYAVSENSRVKIVVQDLLGQTIAIVKDKITPLGSYTDAYNTSTLKNGTYLLVIMNGNKTQTKKFTVLK